MRADIEYFTTEDLAGRWRCSTWSLGQWAKQGRVPGATKLGRDWRFPKDCTLLPQAPTIAQAVDELEAEFARTDALLAKERARRKKG
jgi:hypothetical protein